ncbi:MAG: QueT transporter family protein [Psychrobacillus sp.]|uniref:QueT transporter family protein n=1 Tax=Psychrobacillus sp. MER TA 171 TaxID=2939577 RepID=UPI00203B030C|nr:QueT transporter family protein [Psychrobacillus sp. MER TA 171]MCM3359488.1 QueT transporter family protein [Psychrobacillus sp. MER TA 171]
MNIKTIATSGIIAALYVAVSMLVAPIAFGAFQFRISEMFNHLIIFNKKFFFGIVIGVFITNLFSPLGLYDLTFGVGHSILTLSISILIGKFVKNKIWHMILNTVLFTFTMFIIAIELHLAFDIELYFAFDIANPFYYTWYTVALGEFVVMAVGIPLMLALNKRLKFKELI